METHHWIIICGLKHHVQVGDYSGVRESGPRKRDEDGDIDDDFVMPISCCDDYDWEDNDIPYDLEIFLALAWNNMIIMFAILLVPFIVGETG